MDKPLNTVADIANRLGVQPKAIYYHIHKGNLDMTSDETIQAFITKYLEGAYKAGRPLEYKKGMEDKKMSKKIKTIEEAKKAFINLLNRCTDFKNENNSIAEKLLKELGIIELDAGGDEYGMPGEGCAEQYTRYGTKDDEGDDNTILQYTYRWTPSDANTDRKPDAILWEFFEN